MFLSRYKNSRPSERPSEFWIDYNHQLAKGLVFAGLGRHARTNRYTDSSIYANTGTLTNMDPATDWVRDLGRWALDFDGADDYCLVGTLNNSLMNLLYLTGVTISVWVNTTETGIAALVHGRGTLGASDQFSIAANQNLAGGVELDHWNIIIRDFDVFHQIATEWDLTGVRGAWTHLGFTWRPGDTHCSCYLDGNTVSVHDTATAGSISALTLLYPLHYAASNSAGTPAAFLEGRSSDLCFWSRALSPSEIAPLADPGNVMLSLGGSDPGLLRYRRKWYYFSYDFCPWLVSSSKNNISTIGSSIIKGIK